MIDRDRPNTAVTIALLIFIVLGFLGIAGCASMFTVPTEITYQTSDGRYVHYTSNKDQQGLSFEMSPDGTVKAATASAITPEAAMAAALQIQSEVLKTLKDLIAQGKMAGS